MDTLNHEISRFDARLKKEVGEKIEKELKSAVDTIIAESLPAIIGLQCSQYLNIADTGVPHITDKEYSNYLEICEKKEWDCSLEPQEQVVFFLDKTNVKLVDTFVFIVFRSGQIVYRQLKYEINGICTNVRMSTNWHLGHEPTQPFITLVHHCWLGYFPAERGRESQIFRSHATTLNGVIRPILSICNCGPNAISMDTILNTTFIPLITIFQKEKVYLLNEDVKRALKLEEKQEALDEHEADLEMMMNEYEERKNEYISEQQDKLNELTNRLRQTNQAKKKIMEKFIVQEREKKELKEQLVEITELYELLIDTNGK